MKHSFIGLSVAFKAGVHVHRAPNAHSGVMVIRFS